MDCSRGCSAGETLIGRNRVVKGMSASGSTPWRWLLPFFFATIGLLVLAVMAVEATAYIDLGASTPSTNSAFATVCLAAATSARRASRVPEPSAVSTGHSR